MSRWRKSLLAASIASVAAVGVVALPGVPASAAPADLDVQYECVPSGADSIVRHGPVRLNTHLTFATDLVVGDPLNFTWKLDYADHGRLQSPGYFAPGANVHATGNVELTSSWQGILQPKGSVEQKGKLRPDGELSLPESLNDPGLIDKVGTIKVTPKDIELDFTPPDGTVVANDGNESDNPTDMKVNYGPGWTSIDDRPGSENHVHNDLHETNDLGAWAELSFTGTGVEYIGPHDKDAGPVDIYIDGSKVATEDPSRSDDDLPVNDDLDGGFTIWKSPELKYGKHTIRIVNASSKPAWLDAFKVSTNTAKIPTGYHGAKCKLVGGPVSVTVTVRDKSGPTNSQTPTTPDPSKTPTTSSTPTRTPTGTSTATSTPTRHHSQPTPTNGLGHVVVVPAVTGTSTSTATPTATGPTATAYVRAQVAKIPKGGVDTGEAPDEPDRPYGLMASGAMLLMGSAGGGLVLRRRRAAHAGGTK
ncbi:hypothetical protein [Nonomuraea sp. NPDC001831]|uniref:hypothetical protein n=1 Tax=Nonomuraea sp. NPDC001831 TaxID=3364340 RepID=UPI0036C46432